MGQRTVVKRAAKKRKEGSERGLPKIQKNDSERGLRGQHRRAAKRRKRGQKGGSEREERMQETKTSQKSKMASLVGDSRLGERYDLDPPQLRDGKD